MHQQTTGVTRVRGMQKRTRIATKGIETFIKKIRRGNLWAWQVIDRRNLRLGSRGGGDVITAIIQAGSALTGTFGFPRIAEIHGSENSTYSQVGA